MKSKLYAIYKNKKHKGNERGTSSNDAIKNYVIASLFEEFLDDKLFMSQYYAKPAINGIHHYFIKPKDLNC